MDMINIKLELTWFQLRIHFCVEDTLGCCELVSLLKVRVIQFAFECAHGHSSEF